MTKSKIAELVKICDCPEIQKLWRPKVGDEYYDIYADEIMYVSEDLANGIFNTINCRWLPRIEDCIRLMGIEFCRLIRTDRGFEWETIFNSGIEATARIACLKALKATLKGG